MNDSLLVGNINHEDIFRKGDGIMDFNEAPIGFGLALSGNTAAMNHYAHMTEEQKQEVLNKAHNVRSETEMYTLVANLANGEIV